VLKRNTELVQAEELKGEASNLYEVRSTGRQTRAVEVRLHAVHVIRVALWIIRLFPGTRHPAFAV
jgi:hypothetical protein